MENPKSRRPAPRRLRVGGDSCAIRAMIEIAPESQIGEKISTRDLVWIIVLVIPSLYVLFTLPPLWRDTDGFNEIASTFAPKGIIHWLPGYCFGGRLLVCAASIARSLRGGPGIPYFLIIYTS